MRRSFSDPGYANAVSFLAYEGGQVVGRVDASLLPGHFDGSVKAYLDWICVIRSCRHRGVARTMLKELLAYLRGRGIEMLVALTASNEEARRFYRSIPNSEMKDIGIWIDVGKGEENTN